MTTHNRHLLINLWQTPEDRQSKYWLARSLGANASWARAVRDWPLSKIERLFNLPHCNDPWWQKDKPSIRLQHLITQCRIGGQLTLLGINPFVGKGD